MESIKVEVSLVMMLVMLTVFLGTGQWLDKVSYYDVLAIFLGTVQWLEKKYSTTASLRTIRESTTIHNYQTDN